MRKLRPKSLREVIEKYMGQYPKNYRLWDGTYSDDTLQKLSALLPKASPKQISNAIGDELWMQHFCGECKKYFGRGVAFEDGEAEMQICYSCVRKALKL